MHASRSGGAQNAMLLSIKQKGLVSDIGKLASWQAFWTCTEVLKSDLRRFPGLLQEILPGCWTLLRFPLPPPLPEPPTAQSLAPAPGCETVLEQLWEMPLQQLTLLRRFLACWPAGSAMNSISKAL